MVSSESQIMDGVTQFQNSPSNRGHQREQSPGISVPKMGTKHNNLHTLSRDHEGEENLTDDAIKEIDFEQNYRINSTT